MLNFVIALCFVVLIAVPAILARRSSSNVMDAEAY
jgi:hypothetical protein